MARAARITRSRSHAHRLRRRFRIRLLLVLAVATLLGMACMMWSRLADVSVQVVEMASVAPVAPGTHEAGGGHGW